MGPVVFVPVGVMVFNETGMGNAVLAFPFLAALDMEPSVSHICHIRNRLFLAVRPALRASLSLFPESWMYVPSPVHKDIVQYIVDHRVNLLVNLRNDDYNNPQNRGYLPLRKMLRAHGVAVWDLDDISESTRESYIGEQWAELFGSHHCPIPDVSASSLFCVQRPRARSDSSTIGFVLSGSRGDKRVAPFVWRELVLLILKSTAYSVVVFAGLSEHERREADQVLVGLAPGAAASVEAIEGLRDFASRLAQMRAVVSNDTFGMHLALAFGLRVVGLFSTTRRLVWGPPDSPRYRGLQSRACALCPCMPRQGTCFYQPGVCPCPPNGAFDAAEIAQALLGVLS